MSTITPTPSSADDPAAEGEPTRTDQYVWEVSRRVPQDQREDVARELTAAIEDEVDARVEAGEEPDDARDAVLIGLGRPARLAQQYRGDRQVLIGPGLYPDYLVTLRWAGLFAAIGFGLSWLVGVLGDPEPSWGGAITSLLGAGVSFAVWTGFWVTAVFAVIERVRPEEDRDRDLLQWTPSDLDGVVPDPARRPARQVSIGESVIALLALTLVGVLVLQQWIGWEWALTQGVQLLHPDPEPVTWLVVGGGLLLSMVLELVMVRTGTWTWPTAAANAVLNLAGAAVVAWLLVTDRLLNPDLPGHLNALFGWPTGWSLPIGVVIAVIVAIALWSAVDGLRKARRTHRR